MGREMREYLTCSKLSELTGRIAMGNRFAFDCTRAQ